MSAIIKIEFHNGRKHEWDVGGDCGVAIHKLLTDHLGQADRDRVPLGFEPMSGIANCHVAETDSFTYVIIVRDFGTEVALYQMPADEPLCPVNASRANRFQRFSFDNGDFFPLAAACNAAQEWEDDATGWGATDVE